LFGAHRSKAECVVDVFYFSIASDRETRLPQECSLQGTKQILQAKLSPANLLVVGLVAHDSLLTQSGEHGKKQIFATTRTCEGEHAESKRSKPFSGDLRSEFSLDLLTELTLWDLEVLTGRTVILVHQGSEAFIIDVAELVVLTLDVRNHHVVGGWAELLVLAASEDINTNQVDLGVTVLAGL
jgi:hypothetical protein